MRGGEKSRLLAWRGQFAEGINLCLIKGRSIAMEQVVVPQLGRGGVRLIPPGMNGLRPPSDEAPAKTTHLCVFENREVRFDATAHWPRHPLGTDDRSFETTLQ